jgi:hypothetical protein
MHDDNRSSTLFPITVEEETITEKYEWLSVNKKAMEGYDKVTIKISASRCA